MTVPGTLTASWGVPGQVPVDYRVNWAKSSEDFPSWRAGEGNGNFYLYPTTNSYTISGLEQGVEYKVQRARYRDSQNRITGLTPWSDLVRLVVGIEPQNSPATGAPTVTGTARVGETLTADTSGIVDADGLTNVSFGYQWIRSDGSDDSDISDATGSSYTLVADDEGKTVKVRVSFTDDADNDESLTSAATVAVAELPLTAAFESVPESHDVAVIITWLPSLGFRTRF